MCSEFQGPSASASSQPCLASCGASRVIIFPPPVLVTFPGPILSTCPQETVLGPPGTVLGPPGTVLGPPGMPEGAAGTSLSSHAAEIPRSGRFLPKFISRPILEPREAVLGSLGRLEGGAGAPRSSLRFHGAQFPRSGGSVPRRGPRQASRCSYIFSSRWIHPCRRGGGGGSQQPAGNGSQEQIPDQEKPSGTEEGDAAKEEKEILEV